MVDHQLLAYLEFMIPALAIFRATVWSRIVAAAAATVRTP